MPAVTLFDPLRRFRGLLYIIGIDRQNYILPCIRNTSTCRKSRGLSEILTSNFDGESSPHMVQRTVYLIGGFVGRARSFNQLDVVIKSMGS